MTTPFQRFFPALAAGLLVLAACDSADPVDCAVTPSDPSCPPTSASDPNDFVYDTTGTEIRVTDVRLLDGRLSTSPNATGSGVAPGGDNTITWTSDFTYILTNKVFVNNGQTLDIEAGTVIKGEPGRLEDATALIVARGGTLNADGTAAEPIVMTALADNVNDPSDEPDQGEWGGLIVLGAASTNLTPGVTNIEGVPTTEGRGLYGCGDTFACDDDDSSGSIRYVSIRYGGVLLGTDNEINGLTLGGVGRGTTVEYVEVFKNLDDGIEFFGGTVNTRYIVSAFVGDELFDTDQGYRGLNQFWFGIQSDAPGEGGDNGLEMDGGDADLGGEDATPLSQPVIWNATFVGNNEDRGARIRENAAPSFYRTYWTDFDRGLDIQDNDTGEDSRARLDAGDFALGAVLFGAFTGDRDENGVAGEPIDVASGQTYTLDYLNTIGARFLGAQTGIVSISRTADGGLDPTAAGPALTDLGPAPTNPFFQDAPCIGAVCPGDSWMQGWTALSQLGYLGGPAL